MIGRLCCLACALVFTAAAASQLVSTLRARPLIAFAESLERAGSAPTFDTAFLGRVRSEVERREGCEQLLARSRVTVSLFLVREDEAVDGEEAYRRLVFAEEQARKALACNPVDGNLWFLAGWLGFHLAPNVGLLHEHLLSAIRFAPYRGVALDGRWRALAPVLAELRLARDPVVAADLDRLFQLSTIRTVASVHEALSRNGSAELAAAALARLPEERQAAIERAIASAAPSALPPREYLRFGPRDRLPEQR